MTLKTALRTVPFLGKLSILKNNYHGKPAAMVDATTMLRVGPNHPSVGQSFTPDRETSQVMPFVERPVTVMYPYERLEDLEPWLFVPGNYNGRIGIIWETCTACKACVRACPNDCLHMTSEVRSMSLSWPKMRMTGTVTAKSWRREAMPRGRRETTMESPQALTS